MFQYSQEQTSKKHAYCRQAYTGRWHDAFVQQHMFDDFEPGLSWQP